MYDVVMRWIASLLLLLLPLGAQEKKDTPKKQQPNPTNLKVLKVATGPEVSQIMRTFTQRGWECSVFTATCRATSPATTIRRRKWRGR